MTSNERGTAFEELGSHWPPSAYDGTLHRPCGNCGAEPNQVCTIEVTVMRNRKPVKQTVDRHHPCISRIKEAS